MAGGRGPHGSDYAASAGQLIRFGRLGSGAPALAQRALDYLDDVQGFSPIELLDLAAAGEN